ncbi:MAG: hypothetical protein JXA42_25165, partial [Anaerolineales bacterium]|nr:hypothetical protein [Anaerolineales bacterium]
MPAPLLRTKLYVPPLRPEIIPRPRLVQRLNANLHRKLTLVSAPPGFGKTTLLSDWVHSRNFPIAWLSLDKSDNDPHLFWSYLVAALQTIHPDIGDPFLAALQTTRMQAPPIQTLLAGLINELSELDRLPFALVLDDYHSIASQAVHDNLIFLLDHWPP